MSRIIRDWNGNEIGITPDKGENPMIVHGYGPTGKCCRDCSNLRRELYRGQHYLKCELYKQTRGAASDFRAKWPACKKFEPKHETESEAAQ